MNVSESMHDLEVESADAVPFLYIRQTDTSNSAETSVKEIAVHKDQLPWLIKALQRANRKKRTA